MVHFSAKQFGELVNAVEAADKGMKDAQQRSAAILEQLPDLLGVFDFHRHAVQSIEHLAQEAHAHWERAGASLAKDELMRECLSLDEKLTQERAKLDKAGREYRHALVLFTLAEDKIAEFSARRTQASARLTEAMRSFARES